MDINKCVLKGFLHDRRACALVLVFGLFHIITGCAKISNPEKSGGEILAVPEGHSCRFSISGDGKWMQYMGDESPLLKPDAKNRSQQRQTFLTDLETGKRYFAEPDPDVQNRIGEGLGPDGLGCFSPDNSKLYFTTADWGNFAERERTAGDTQNHSQQSPAISLPGRQTDRYHYEVDLTTEPFIIRETDGVSCVERPEAVKPDIRVERPSDKVIEIYSTDGRRLARHRPRGWFNTISIWDLDHNQWEMDYSLSPEGNYLAYRINESRPMFAAPTHGYLLNLSPDNNQRPVFLAASVYSMEWDNRGNFYACTSHNEHRSVIARWDPKLLDSSTF